MNADDQTCAQRWANNDAPQYKGPHVCSLASGHQHQHRCACGAEVPIPRVQP